MMDINKSYIGWIDFDEEGLSAIKQRIRGFNDPGTLDELGLGEVRDYFANILFPGTMTGMTRARYYLFIPAIYYSYEKRMIRIPGDDIREQQNRLRKALEKQYGKHAGDQGVIGIKSKDELETLPNKIYWSSIKKLGILQKPTWSRAVCVKYINNYIHEKESKEIIWDLPKDKSEANYFMKEELLSEKLSFDLDPDEAEFLKRKFLQLGDNVQNGHKCLYEYLFINRIRNFKKIAFIWEVPHLSRQKEVQQDVRDAKLFSFLSRGIWLAYYCLLTKTDFYKKQDNDRYAIEYRDWVREARKERCLKMSWLEGFLNRHKKVIDIYLFEFLKKVLNNITKNECPSSVLSQLIKNREAKIQGRKGKPKKLSDDKWEGVISDSGKSCFYHYDYRWHQARWIISDIRNPKKRIG